MATIIRHGKTPKWGVDKTMNGLIIDSFTTSTEIKDYEQTNQSGAVCGYLVYDQTVNFDFSGTVLAGDTGDANCIGNAIGMNITNISNLSPEIYNSGINIPTYAIVKSISQSQTAGGATNISVSGTFYNISSEPECNN